MTNTSTRAVCESGRRQRSTRGFTIVELLVVMAVISLLVALLVPATMSARESARRAQCQNNIRNISIAMMSCIESGQRFPASGNYGLPSAGAPLYHSWVVNVLPWLDHREISDKWKVDLPSNVPPNRELASAHVSVLACPSDISVTGRGDLTYVVNGGFGWTSISSAGVSDCPIATTFVPMDLNGNRVTCPLSAGQDGQPSDKELFFMTGLFFLENWKGSGGTVRHHTNNDVYDGLSQTIMFSENVRAGADPLDDDANWASPVALRNSFFVSFAVCENSTCAPGNVDYRLANSGQGAVNSSLTSAEGNAPWPSSFHSGGVNFAFADGHLRFISQYIDGGVYAALVSPQGARITGPLRQKIASDQDY